MADLDPYYWIVVCGCICGFVYAFGIGANDVANAFASSVSSKSLSLKQAVIAAGIFEFLGAFFLGASVASTIKDDVVFLDQYEDQPQVLMYGMFTSLFTATIMLLVATHFGLPVSTTHTIVGTIIGFSISAEGFKSVDWGGIKNIFISSISVDCRNIQFRYVQPLAYLCVAYRKCGTTSLLYVSYGLLVGITINAFYILYK